MNFIRFFLLFLLFDNSFSPVNINVKLFRTQPFNICTDHIKSFKGISDEINNLSDGWGLLYLIEDNFVIIKEFKINQSAVSIFPDIVLKVPAIKSFYPLILYGVSMKLTIESD